MSAVLFRGLSKGLDIPKTIKHLRYIKSVPVHSTIGHHYRQLRLLGQATQKGHDNKSPKLSDLKQQDMKIVTVPNILTSTRILLTPAIGYLIWNEMHSYAMMCFSLAALTDLLDGLIARRFNQASRLGAILDPIADKFLLTTCFIALHHANLMPIWLVGGFIGRDITLMLGGALLRYQSFTQRRPSFKQYLDFDQYPATNFEPTYVSKCNTALQCLLIVTHLLSHSMTGSPTYDMTISGLHALTATTTMVSLGQYGLRASRSITSGVGKFP